MSILSAPAYARVGVPGGTMGNSFRRAAGLKFVVAALLLAAATALGGCVTHGPVAVAPNQAFKGIADLLADTPEGGSLNILVAHGMRADSDQNQVDVRNHLARRLNLTLREKPEPRILLKDEWPRVFIGGDEVWKKEDWPRDAPYVDIAIYSAPGDRTVAFYSFNYWKPLARIKCRELIRYDTNLLGPSSRSDWCVRELHEAMPKSAQSTKPLVGNKWLKSEIMDWGFGDATIVMSKFEGVIRAAAREAMAVEIADVASRKARVQLEMSGDQAVFQQALDSKDQRYAIITQSLGGFVLLDALTTPASSDAIGRQDLLHASAPENILCRAQQFHMLANQVTLLRLSQMTVGLGEGAKAACPASPARQQARKNSDEPIQVVAYHDPNDQLTFYNAGSSTEATLGVTTINVVAPFAPIWVWFLAADPSAAHDGQKKNVRIMDMVALGHH